jgi:N-acetylglucosaminyldiphosphoundecaprenol N-acetyl-beta-D-mannosaminyltransferase
MSGTDGRPASRFVLGMRVDATTYAAAAASIVQWAQEGTGRYVCVANVHMTMEAHDDPAFMAIVSDADLVTSDGMPLVWALRALGLRDATRVYGPTLTLRVCEAAALAGVPVGFHGGRPEVIGPLVESLRGQVPNLRIDYAVSPPFGTHDAAEDAATVAAILCSGVRILFVGLGCPKQERWMGAHRDRLPVVQLGVGAAFDFHAGAVRQAPPALQRLGMEWAFRFAMEPRRLAGRYLRHNPRFLALFAAQLVAWRRAVRKQRIDANRVH